MNLFEIVKTIGLIDLGLVFLLILLIIVLSICKAVRNAIKENRR